MKLTTILCIVLLFAACGGSSGTSSTEPQPTTSLPDIIDNYYDEIFKYSNPDLYVGEYAVDTDDFPDTCSNMFNSPASVMEIISISSPSIILYDHSDKVQLTLPTFNADETDLYGYYGDFFTLICFVGVASANDNVTKDALVFYCEDISYQSCQTKFSRNADYDFTSRDIKSARYDSANIIKGMME